MIGLSELGGPIACIGLAVLLLARTRVNRIAGLGYAGVGTVLLAASLAPANAGELAAAAGGIVVLCPLLAWLFKREPWLIAFGTLAFIPFRVGFLGHSLLVPLYAIALGAAGLLLWQLVEGDDRTRELGIASWPLALYLVWIACSVTWSGALHAAVNPAAGNFSTIPASFQTPSRSGPRHCGQSAARVACASNTTAIVVMNRLVIAPPSMVTRIRESRCHAVIAS